MKGTLFAGLSVVLLTALSTYGGTDLVTDLASATNHYEWTRLSREIDSRGITVATTNAAAFVRHQLVHLTAADSKRRDEIMSQIVALGQRALPTLIAAISNAARPAPIFGDSAVANLPIFSMQLLARMKSLEAVPALIDFIDKFETDVHSIVDGKPHHQVVETLKAITGEDFGMDKARWEKWYDERKRTTPK